MGEQIQVQVFLSWETNLNSTRNFLSIAGREAEMIHFGGISKWSDLLSLMIRLSRLKSLLDRGFLIAANSRCD